MPGQRLPMRKIRDVLRLTAAGMSSRKIAASLVVGATTVVDCLQRARAAGVSWPLLDDLSDEALEARLFPASTALAEIRARRPQPHWPTIHRELRRPGVTLQLVWEEHRAAHPEGYGYSRFCELYRAWEGRLSPTMRQTHVAGERLFVDYAGTTLDVIDASTGEAMPAQLFVAALGASNYTYAEATWTQGLADWIGSHTRTFAFFDGVSAMVVSDNLKSGVGKSWLSCALAQKACCDGYTVHYARVPRLFADLELAHGDGRFARLFRTLVKADLLILDDRGPDRLSANQRRDLMEIVEDRYGRSPRSAMRVPGRTSSPISTR